MIGNKTGRSLCDVLEQHGFKFSPYDIARIAICIHSSGRVVLSLSEDDMPPHHLNYAIVKPDTTHDPERYILVIASRGIHSHFMIQDDDARLTNLQKDIDTLVTEILEFITHADEIMRRQLSSA